jgi:hypothetical protein
VRISPEEAARIALKEVEKRERWSGKADTAVKDGNQWIVTVWGTTKEPGGSRIVSVGKEGDVVSYVYGK